MPGRDATPETGSAGRQTQEAGSKAAVQSELDGIPCGKGGASGLAAQLLNDVGVDIGDLATTR